MKRPIVTTSIGPIRRMGSQRGRGERMRTKEGEGRGRWGLRRERGEREDEH